MPYSLLSLVFLLFFSSVNASLIDSTNDFTEDERKTDELDPKKNFPKTATTDNSHETGQSNALKNAGLIEEVNGPGGYITIVRRDIAEKLRELCPNSPSIDYIGRFASDSQFQINSVGTLEGLKNSLKECIREAYEDRYRKPYDGFTIPVFTAYGYSKTEHCNLTVFTGQIHFYKALEDSPKQGGSKLNTISGALGKAKKFQDKCLWKLNAIYSNWHDASSYCIGSGGRVGKNKYEILKEFLDNKSIEDLNKCEGWAEELKTSRNSPIYKDFVALPYACKAESKPPGTRIDTPVEVNSLNPPISESQARLKHLLYLKVRMEDEYQNIFKFCEKEYQKTNNVCSCGKEGGCDEDKEEEYNPLFKALYNLDIEYCEKGGNMRTLHSNCKESAEETCSVKCRNIVSNFKREFSQFFFVDRFSKSGEAYKGFHAKIKEKACVKHIEEIAKRFNAEDKGWGYTDEKQSMESKREAFYKLRGLEKQPDVLFYHLSLKNSKTGKVSAEKALSEACLLPPEQMKKTYGKFQKQCAKKLIKGSKDGDSSTTNPQNPSVSGSGSSGSGGGSDSSYGGSDPYQGYNSGFNNNYTDTSGGGDTSLAGHAASFSAKNQSIRDSDFDNSSLTKGFKEDGSDRTPSSLGDPNFETDGSSETSSYDSLGNTLLPEEGSEGEEEPSTLSKVADKIDDKIVSYLTSDELKFNASPEEARAYEERYGQGGAIGAFRDLKRSVKRGAHSAYSNLVPLSQGDFQDRSGVMDERVDLSEVQELMLYMFCSDPLKDCGSGDPNVSDPNWQENLERSKERYRELSRLQLKEAE